MVNAYDHHPPPIPDLEKLWALWELKTEGPGDVADKLGKVSLEPETEAANAPITSLHKLKLAVFKDVFFFYAKNDQAQFDTLMKDLHSNTVQKFAIDHRLKRAKEGKEAANKKYKEGYKVEAMYRYAIAWVLLLPYYPEHYPKGKDPNHANRDFRDEIGKLDTALFSNISAMALMLWKEVEGNEADKEILGQITVDAAEICISAKEFVSCGIMTKSCRRAREVAEGQKPNTKHRVSADKIRFFKEQEEKIKDEAADRPFDDVALKKSAKPVKA